MFYERLKALCAKKNLSVSAALNIMGLSSGNMSYWRRGRLPKGDVLRRMANFFDVSVDTLVGEKQRMLASQQEDLLSIFSTVPENRREEFLNQAATMAHDFSEGSEQV